MRLVCKYNSVMRPGHLKPQERTLPKFKDMKIAIIEDAANSGV